MAYFSDTAYGADGVWISGDLTASDTAGAVFNWTNTEGCAVLVDKILIDITTASTSACTLDAGYTATSTATSSDTMIDGVNANSTAVYNSMKEAGTGNAVWVVRAASGKYITCSKKTGAAAGLAGKYYIHYKKVRP